MKRLGLRTRKAAYGQSGNSCSACGVRRFSCTWDGPLPGWTCVFGLGPFVIVWCKYVNITRRISNVFGMSEMMRATASASTDKSLGMIKRHVIGGLASISVMVFFLPWIVFTVKLIASDIQNRNIIPFKTTLPPPRTHKKKKKTSKRTYNVRNTTNY